MLYSDQEKNVIRKSLKSLQGHLTQEDTEVKVLFKGEERGDEEKKNPMDLIWICPPTLID